jgi:uncharacterized protein YbjT (DUF2867 family)
MVGGYALRYALDNPSVGHVTSIGRKKLGISHPKLVEILHQDFADCSALAEVLSGQDAAVFCLGTYTGAVSDEDLRKITVDYTVEFAGVLHHGSPSAEFSFLSGNGADPTGRSRMPFARYKGQAEKVLLDLGFRRVYIFRPAYIYPVEPRKEPNLSYRLRVNCNRDDCCILSRAGRPKRKSRIDSGEEGPCLTTHFKWIKSHAMPSIRSSRNLLRSGKNTEA